MVSNLRKNKFKKKNKKKKKQSNEKREKIKVILHR